MPLKSWLEVPQESDFSLANIPFGIISIQGSESKHPAVAIGDYALDLHVFASKGGFSNLVSIAPHLSVFSQPTLNQFASLGRSIHKQVRNYLQQVLDEQTPYPDILKNNASLQKEVLLPLSSVAVHVPLDIGDYTDFYACKNHAYNVGVIFRGPANALQPNYTNLPVGYHGRASSVVVSGTPVRRPWGQILGADGRPEYAPCRRLDIELELAAFVCRENGLGSRVRVDKAADFIFGFVLMNDWSARDIQAWEYVPLGPFNSKNFATTISPWVVLADALEPFHDVAPENPTPRQPYLEIDDERPAYNIHLEVDLKPSISASTTTIARTNANNLLWSFPQMIAHHTVTGCPLRVGDLLGSGTISGTEPNSQGSLLEMSGGGKTEIALQGGETRKYLVDGDEVTIRGWCDGGEQGSGRVGFGECRGRILEAWKEDGGDEE